MLAIQLERSLDGLDGPRLGPVNGLLIEGQSLKILPLNIEFLCLAMDEWQSASESFVGLTIETPTLIYAERSRYLQGKFLGPFDFVRISRTRIYTMENERQSIAQFNPLEGDWHFCHDNSNWPRIVFLPCGYAHH